MLKKAILGILAVVLLAGTANLAAQRRKGRTEARPGQEQVQKGQARQKGLRPGQQGFDGWLAALTKAYRENDREKMGQLLRNMKQRRQKRQRETDAPGKRGQHFRHERWEGKGHAEQWQERKDGRGWRGRGFERQGKGGRGRAFRSKSWREHSKGFRGEDIERCYPRFRGRGMGKRGRAFSEKVGHERGPHGETRERFARGDYGPGEWGRGPRRRGMGRAGRRFQGRGQRKQYWHEHQEHMPGNSEHESDFDWDW